MHDGQALKARIKEWGRELGFDAIGVAGVDLPRAEADLAAWIKAGCHGMMNYMVAHGVKRARPAELIPGTKSVIVARMNYLTHAEDEREHIARYARGRDYHKVLRQRLQKLAQRMGDAAGGCATRVFTDSAPVMEVELARQAGLGWRGKHTLLLSRNAGSWFFLGEIYTDLALPVDAPVTDHCGACTACIDACPTAAITAPYQLDARRCISYLTIELKEAIPVEQRPAIGAHVYGCDACQTVCPWNRQAPLTREPDFAARNQFDAPDLCALFAWGEDEFARRTAGSAIARLGHERWLRNLAVALGNAPASPASPAVRKALLSRRQHPSALVREHVEWALRQHGQQENVASP